MEPSVFGRSASSAAGTGSVSEVGRDSPEVCGADGISDALISAARRHLAPYGAARGGGPSLRVILGDCDESRRLVSADELTVLCSTESFIVRGRQSETGYLLVAVGTTLRGNAFAIFELLQLLGFAFLHPLKPVCPETLHLAEFDVCEEPRWSLRGTHYHTQHPLELTNLVNGYDEYGRTGDRAQWAATLPEWEACLEWLVAQKQNYFEWMLMCDLKVPGNHNFELSSERQDRLLLLVQKAHDLGVEIGIDVPVTLQQQHALSLLPRPTGRWEEDVQIVGSRIKWLLDCGLDHLGTELGSTEFTKGMTEQYFVDILSFVKKTIGPNRQLFVKNHCSSDQQAAGFPDPRPGKGEDINFNYIAYFADPTIVQMPHTVQIYSLKDPAPTYGNTSFADLRDWTRYLLQQGRPVVFYPETSYWVNYDSSVPLFLGPIYARTRVEDANDLDSLAGGSRRVLGQMNFESAWQWGYWLGNSAQAAAAWQPIPDVASVFRRLFRFLARGVQDQLVELLCDYAREQKRLLIDGIGGAPPPPGIGLPLGMGALTGITYLKGSEGLSDLSQVASRKLKKGPPEPDRLRFTDFWVLRRGLCERRRVWYREHLRPLLSEMADVFSGLSARFPQLLLQAGPACVATELLRDMDISARLLALRCAQVLALYDHAADGGVGYVPRSLSVRRDWREARLAEARAALVEALLLVPEREANYGLMGGASWRVAHWGAPNPTAYSYGYLWATHRLFYWQRDQAIVEWRKSDPCFAIINDPVDLGLEGGGGRGVRALRAFLMCVLDNALWTVPFCGWFGVPADEPSPLVRIVGRKQSERGCLGELHADPLVKMRPPCPAWLAGVLVCAGALVLFGVLCLSCLTSALAESDESSLTPFGLSCLGMLGSVGLILISLSCVRLQWIEDVFQAGRIFVFAGWWSASRRMRSGSFSNKNQPSALSV